MRRIQVGQRMGKTIHILMRILTISYGIYAFYLLIFGSIYRSSHWGRILYNFVPFKTISLYLFNDDNLSWGIIFNNLIGNLLVFMPLGFFTAFFRVKMRNSLRILIMSFVLSVAVEVTQGLLGVGSVDVDDVILNTVGGLIGYICFWVFRTAFLLFFDWEYLVDKKRSTGT